MPRHNEDMNYDIATPPPKKPSTKATRNWGFPQILLWTLTIITIISNTAVNVLAPNTIYPIFTGGLTLVLLILVGVDIYRRRRR